jgi:tetratricopeptide (TPR) repeat protein
MTPSLAAPKAPDQLLQPAHARLLEAEEARRAGDLGKARSLCEALLTQHPGYVGALQTLGAVHLAKNNSRQALSCFIQAAILCPKDSVNLTNLATCLLKAGGRQLAAQITENAKRLRPDDPEAYCLLAEIYREDREYLLAAECFRKAHALAAPSADSAHGLGDCYFQLGLVEEAAKALKTAHGLEPRSISILYSLSQLPTRLCAVDLKTALAEARKTGSQSQDEFETALEFVKAAVLDRSGKYEEAWNHLIVGNRRAGAGHAQLHQRNAAKMAGALEQARNYQKPALPTGGEECPISLFILGPSRSGKTCLELLMSHADGVKRGHESRFAETAAKRASQQSGLLTISNPDGLPAALDSRFVEVYIEEIKEFAKNAKIVTDTYPAMISYLGKVARCVPHCRFVFMKRDKNDLALRIFMRHYKAGNHYGYDIKTIGHYISWYKELADRWLDIFPEITTQVQYEDMVAEPRAILERIAKLCGVAASTGPLPDIGDDRGCSKPYQKFIAAELAG